MGKPASPKDRGKGSSFSLSYEGAQREPSNHITLGKSGFSFKGSAIALLALAGLTAAGAAAYATLSGQSQGNPSGTGVTPGTSVTAGAADTAATAPTRSGPPVSPTPDAPQAAGAEVTAVREHRKVVLRSGSNVDLDFTNGSPDIIFSLPANADDGYTIAGENGDLATVNGTATAESCAAATAFGFTIDQKNIRRGLTACVLTDENRVAALTILGWQADDVNYAGGLSSVTMDVTTWEKPESTA